MLSRQAFLIDLKPRAVRYQEGWDLSGRILGSLAVILSTFVACAIFVLAEGVDSTFLFLCTICLVVISGLSIAVLQVR